MISHGEEVCGHSGDIRRFTPTLWHVPRSGVTVAALLNYQAGGESRDKDRLAQSLIRDMRARAVTSSERRAPRRRRSWDPPIR